MVQYIKASMLILACGERYLRFMKNATVSTDQSYIHTYILVLNGSSSSQTELLLRREKGVVQESTQRT